MAQSRHKLKRRAYLLRRARLLAQKATKFRLRRDRNRRLKYSHLRNQAETVVLPKFSEPKIITIGVPYEFCFLTNTVRCAEFFKSLLEYENDDTLFPYTKIKLDLSGLTSVDFAATMLLTAVGEELALRKVILQGNRPKEDECEHYLQESGFYNQKIDDKGRRIIQPGKSSFTKVGRGEVRVEQRQLKEFYELSVAAYKNVGNNDINLLDTHSVLIKEICGNAAEWSDSERKNWIIGSKTEPDRTVFVVLDLGVGILNSLYRKFSSQFADFFTNATDDKILGKAFDEQYESKSKESNRNRGLPFIKKCAEDGIVSELMVISNNVRLCFDDISQNWEFAKDKDVFAGTLYSWVVENKNNKNNIKI